MDGPFCKYLLVYILNNVIMIVCKNVINVSIILYLLLLSISCYLSTVNKERKKKSCSKPFR